LASDAVASLDVRGPNLVARTRRQMVGHAPAIGTETESIGKTVLSARELSCIRPVEVYAEDLADFVADDLHQHAVIVNQKLRRAKDRHPVPRGELFKCAGVYVVSPNVRLRLRVVFGERPTGSVSSLFHAQEQHAATVREKPCRLPRHLQWNIELEIAQPGAIRIH